MEKIFDLAVHGAGASKIMRILIQEQIPAPSWLHYLRDGSYAHIFWDAPPKQRHAWNVGKVKTILKDGTTQIFARLVKCADCGWSMWFGQRHKGKHTGYYYFGK